MHHNRYDALVVGLPMRVILTLALLSVTALAGCLSGDGTTDGPIAADAYEAPPVPEVSGQETIEVLRDFAATYSERAGNLADHTGARDWIASEFESYGLEVYRQEFTNGIDQENILGILWGEVPYTWVVVGGHYDVTTTDCIVGGQISGATSGTTPADATCINRKTTQGAYDDGSGTVQTVMLAKAFAEQYQATGTKPYYTMVFVPFDGEERGLQGSQAFAGAVNHNTCEADPTALAWCERYPSYDPFPYNDGDITVRGMLDLDMAGLNWPGTEAPLYFDSNSQALRDHVEADRTAMQMPDDMIKYQGITLGRSDYAHFFAMGVPTGFFISDFEEFELPGDSGVVTPPPGASPVELPLGNWPAYPFWHVEDTWDTMVLMAGSEEDLAAGFQTILDLSASILHLYAMQPTADLDAEIL